jgi:hypothetical protein
VLAHRHSEDLKDFMLHPLDTVRRSSRVFILLLSFNHFVQAATVTSVWNVASGNWTEPTNWVHSPTNAGGDYPHDGAITYDVKLTNGSVVLEQAVGIQKLAFAGGTLSNAATLSVADEFRWTAGTLAGPGTLVVTNVSAGGGTNESTIRIFAVNANASFTALDHRGTIILENGYAFTDQSVISGRILVETNGYFIFDGTNRCADGSLVRGEGRVFIPYIEGTLTNACRMSIAMPHFGLDGPGRLVFAEGAKLTVRYGYLRGSGSVEIGPQASVLFDQPSTWTDRSLTNYGTCVFSNVVIAAGSPTNSAVLHNCGRVDVASWFFGPDNLIWLPTIINYGILCFTNDWWTDLRGNITNYGSVEMLLNRLFVSNFVNFGTARLMAIVYANRIENHGEIMSPWSVTGTLTNNATCDVTSNGFSINGTFQQSSNGVLRVTVDERVVTNQPAIRIMGDGSFDGTLVVQLTNGFQPSLGQRLRLMTNNSAQGFFRRIRGLDLGNGLRLAPEVTASTFDLVVVAATNTNEASLTFARTGTGVTLRAPASLQGFFLQSTTNLVNPNWQNIDFVPSTTTIPINTNIPQLFLRARDPACCE